MDPMIRQVLDDLAAEFSALDAFVSGLAGEDWLTPTPAEGWDVRDSIAHLALSNDMAFECVIEGRSRTMSDAIQAFLESPESAAAFERRLLNEGRRRTPGEVLAWWRLSGSRLCEALAAKSPGERIPWGPNRMSVVSFATARLMETWAHGVDCFDAFRAKPPYTGRLRHVAWLSLRALPYAFGRVGLEPPGPVRLELTSPAGESWTIGPDSSPTVIRGTAVDWCRVATHRDRHGEKANLEANGPGGTAVIEHVQAYL